MRVLLGDYMNFGKITKFILFGGGKLMSEFALMTKDYGYETFIFTSPRHLTDNLSTGGESLKDILESNHLKYFSTENINEVHCLRDIIDEGSIGIGFGESWSFSKDIIDQFGGKLIDFMGIRLPQYRGGAHYTWQILRRNRIGSCNLQLINENMVQGEFDSGEIIKSKEYFFPPTARIPVDYFETSIKEEIAFLKEFLDEIKKGREFNLIRLQENFSIYFPRLCTKKHAYINWTWDTQDIETFICAFDDPYSGAMTFFNREMVILKKCFAEYNDSKFHPFQSGLIYKIDEKAIYVATLSGTLIIKDIFNEEGKNIMSRLKTGYRFYTPQSIIEEAMQFAAHYDSSGLRE
jgi:methionyl-tRNA formyltransferase